MYIYIQQYKNELTPSRNNFGLALAHFYIAVYILDMTPCESFLLAKNGSSKLKLLLLEYLYI